MWWEYNKKMRTAYEERVVDKEEMHMKRSKKKFRLKKRKKNTTGGEKKKEEKERKKREEEWTEVGGEGMGDKK